MALPPKPALLLVGQSGSGKSPLGDLLARRIGWAHFDFGARLRAIAAGFEVDGLTEEERAFVAELLSRHALFPDERFPTVARILRAFIERNPAAPGVILNGMPRHEGQARSVAEILRVTAVVFLECSAEAAAERIRKRAAGLGADHSGRPDDTAEAAALKLRIFEERTRPLVEYYTSLGAAVLRLKVDASSGEETLAGRLLPPLLAALDRTPEI